MKSILADLALIVLELFAILIFVFVAVPILIVALFIPPAPRRR